MPTPKPDRAEVLTEAMAAEIHEVYLATSKRLGWAVRPENDVAYNDLPEASKELDRAFVRWHLDRLRDREAKLAKAREALREIEDKTHATPNFHEEDHFVICDDVNEMAKAALREIGGGDVITGR